MRGFMFRNAKGALFFAVATMLGAAMLIGSEDNEGALIRTAEELERQKAQAEDVGSGGRDLPPAQGFATADEAQLEFSSDEDLVDQAQGFDPSPDIEPPLIPAEPQVELVESSAEIVYN